MDRKKYQSYRRWSLRHFVRRGLAMVIAIKIMMKGIVKVAADWDDIADYSSAFNGKITGCGIIA